MNMSLKTLYQVNTYSDIPSAPFCGKGELTKQN